MGNTKEKTIKRYWLFHWVIVKSYRDGLIDRKEFVRQWESVQALCREFGNELLQRHEGA
jgi:hypothetical protein